MLYEFVRLLRPRKEISKKGLVSGPLLSLFLVNRYCVDNLSRSSGPLISKICFGLETIQKHFLNIPLISPWLCKILLVSLPLSSLNL